MTPTAMQRVIPLTLLAALTLAALSCNSFYSSSPAEKLAAYSAHRESWHDAVSPKDFGLARSVQIIQASKVLLGKNRLAYDGGLGMATLITRDGYALTAAHVVTHPPLDAFIATTESNKRPGPTVHVHRQPFNAGRPGDSPTSKKSPANRLVAYSPRLAQPTALPVKNTTVRILRIVKLFPERDIALIKLPLRTHLCFELCRKPLDQHTVLFSSGNWATPYRGISAGTVTSLNTAHPDATVVRSTTPLAKGDSGGPVFDADGHLVGIASRVIPSQLLPYPKLRHSSLRTLDPATIAALIAADRKSNP